MTRITESSFHPPSAFGFGVSASKPRSLQAANV
jgi:hypothetical protein